MSAAVMPDAAAASPTGRRLRDYQACDVDTLRARWGTGRLFRLALVWATGLGKTDPIAKIATDEIGALPLCYAGPVLILAHRGELLNQLRDRCRAYRPDIEVGRVQAQDREYHAPIIVATVQTLSRASIRDKMPRPRLVIVDEAHHAAAKTYETIMRWAGCYETTPVPGGPVVPPTCRALGVTATMDRAERRGLGLGDVWEETVAERGIAWGIDHGPDPDDPYVTRPVWRGEGDAPAGYAWQGWLVPIFGRTVVADHVDLSKAKISRTTKDYADADLGGMIEQDAPEIVKAWYREARLPDGSHRITGAFVPTLAAARAMVDAFVSTGITAEMVEGKTPAHIRGDVYERTGIYGRVATGATQVLVSVGVLTEGWDCPPVSCILMARPTLLDHLYQQCVGRGTRPLDLAYWFRWDGDPFPPKRDLLVLDVVGMTEHVSLRTLVNLLPGAPYRGRPCARCGEPKPCACPPDPAAPDGGRESNRRKLLGPADYRDADLLRDARDEGLNWLATIPEPGYEGIPFLKVSGTDWEYYVILWHNADGSWSGGWITASGPHMGGWVIEDTDEETARLAVESLELTSVEGRVRDAADRRDDPWRLARKRPSPKAMHFAAGLGVPHPEDLTAGACSDEIDRRLATRRLVATF
jgi:superfamily II DNA or RNA helicase